MATELTRLQQQHTSTVLSKFRLALLELILDHEEDVGLPVVELCDLVELEDGLGVELNVAIVRGVNELLGKLALARSRKRHVLDALLRILFLRLDNVARRNSAQHNAQEVVLDIVLCQGRREREIGHALVQLDSPVVLADLDLGEELGRLLPARAGGTEESVKAQRQRGLDLRLGVLLVIQVSGLLKRSSGKQGLAHVLVDARLVLGAVGRLADLAVANEELDGLAESGERGWR